MHSFCRKSIYTPHIMWYAIEHTYRYRELTGKSRKGGCGKYFEMDNVTTRIEFLYVARILMKMCIQGWSAFMQIYIYIFIRVRCCWLCVLAVWKRRLRRQRWDDDKMNHVRKEFGKALHFRRHFFFPFFSFLFLFDSGLLVSFCFLE